MAAKQEFDIQLCKGPISGALNNEEQRNWSEEQWARQMKKPGNHYDPTRAHLNFEIIKGHVIQKIDTSKSLATRFDERCKELGIPDPNFKKDPRTGKVIPTNRITTVNIIFGGNRERMHQIAFGNQKVDTTPNAPNPDIKRSPDIERWALDMYDYACRHWGEDNIIGFYVHLDELNPHCHCTVIPVATTKKKQNISFNKAFWTLRNKGEVLRKLHDDLAVVNKKWGLERGDNIAETGVVHKDKSDWIKEQLGNQATIKRQEKAIKGLNSMVARLTFEHKTLTDQIESLERLSEYEEKSSQEELCRLREKLKSVDEKLADKMTKLEQAEEKMKMLQQDIAAAKEIKASIEKSNQQASKVLSPNLALIHMVALSDAICSLREVWDQVRTSPEEEELMNDSFVGAMCSDFTNIAQCAFYLSVGAINDATNFAETHGGGGGSQSDLPWRDDKDKDFDWLLKCLHAAVKMMRPSSGYRMKSGKRSRYGY